LSLLAFIDDEPIGLINAFEGFSTFQCRPLLNIHDIIVIPRFRQQGAARQMLQRLEQIAIERGCCKLTLEVLERNLAA
ncbi:GNAT family acetyltransferase, partial [Candidatus Endoriftia persephone str. Guaymas]|nr:GNAT family acetyltransferase [Candidatus Endoriftia persephone str. Guaymas]